MPAYTACLPVNCICLRVWPLCDCSKVVRKSIARLLTVISQQQRAALREVFKGKVSLLHSGELGMGMAMGTCRWRQQLWEAVSMDKLRRIAAVRHHGVCGWHACSMLGGATPAGSAAGGQLCCTLTCVKRPSTGRQQG